jgi:hypothetical protein
MMILNFTTCIKGSISFPTDDGVSFSSPTDRRRTLHGIPSDSQTLENQRVAFSSVQERSKLIWQDDTQSTTKVYKERAQQLENAAKRGRSYTIKVRCPH